MAKLSDLGCANLQVARKDKRGGGAEEREEAFHFKWEKSFKWDPSKRGSI